VTPAISPGKSFDARFTPPRSGTFMYHTHLHDQSQLAAGLYGPLIVLEPGAVFDSAHENIVLVSRGGPGVSEGPVLLNGTLKPPPLHWRTGQQYRLRVINIAAFDGIGVALRASDKPLQWRAVARDGADLPPAQAVMQEARQATLPGQTFDFEYEPTEAGDLQLEVGSRRLKMTVVQQIEVR
jgi:manganese oxidase